MARNKNDVKDVFAGKKLAPVEEEKVEKEFISETSFLPGEKSDSKDDQLIIELEKIKKRKKNCLGHWKK